MIYKLILTIRNARYRDGRRSVKAAVPTVCVGNITVGGTGKTPHTEMILRELINSDRWGMKDLAVLSRGYKRRSKGYQELPLDASAALYGDEPAQIKHKFPGVTVAVDKDRVEACKLLKADYIILDDAYQYRKLKADLDIVLTPYDRPVTEDSLLPGGRLRDLKSRLYDAGIVIVTKCPYDLDDSEKQEAAATLGYDSFDPGTCIAVHKDRSQLLLFTKISYERPEPVFPDADARFIYSHKVVLFSGIADDKPLRNHLSDSYTIAERFTLPDHYRYTAADIRWLRTALRRNPTAAFVTTEKDAQRLRDLQKLPAEFRQRMFYLPITTGFLTEKERQLFIDKITQL